MLIEIGKNSARLLLLIESPIKPEHLDVARRQKGFARSRSRLTLPLSPKACLPGAEIGTFGEERARSYYSQEEEAWAGGDFLLPPPPPKPPAGSQQVRDVDSYGNQSRIQAGGRDN